MAQFVEFASQTVQWRSQVPLDLDVAEFEQAVQAAPGRPDELEQLMHAVQLYQGDLLPECYEKWVDPEREALARRPGPCAGTRGAFARKQAELSGGGRMRGTNAGTWMNWMKRLTAN